MTSTGVQAAMSACEQVPVAAPRRKRSAATKKQTASAVPAEQPKKPRRRFQKVVLGGELEVASGYVERWQGVTEEKWDRKLRTRVQVTRRERVLDEDGFPAGVTGGGGGEYPNITPVTTTGWRESERHLTNSQVTLRFLEGASLPSSISVGRGGKVFLGKPKGTEPPQAEGSKLRLLATRDERRNWVATLPVIEPEPKPEPEPAPEQWFRIELSDEVMEAGGWEFFPQGWCAKLVPTTAVDYSAAINTRDGRDYIRGKAQFDPDWVYAQLPFHYFVNMENENGEVTVVYRTDSAGVRRPAQDGSHWGYHAVECGIWIPCALLNPISVERAAEIFEEIQAMM